jgi:predicted DNA-binding transcriptional regulator YafY
MAINKNALIRYKTIDHCLRNRFRKWTLDDLLDACSDALYEYEGIRKGISLRTVQMDIQMMRSDRLGYNAPIVVVDKKYYTYEDPKYSIANIPLTTQDLSTLGEVVTILQQFKGFRHFQEVDDMIGRLEHKIFKQQHQSSPVVDFEKNENLRGLEHLSPLYQAIAQRQVLQMAYQSFRARVAQTFTFHPQVLKEYRNRWFVVGIREAGGELLMLALDRIQHFEPLPKEKYHAAGISATYFDDALGVTKGTGMVPITVRFWADSNQTPYIISKPVHRSQQLIEHRDGGAEFEMTLVWNPELERELLGFGEHIQVLSPPKLVRFMQKRLSKALARYGESLLDKN